MYSRPLLGAALAAAFLTWISPAAAQHPVRLPPDHFGIKEPLRSASRPGPAAAVPPSSWRPIETEALLPAIPVGRGGNPQPQNPPAREIDASSGSSPSAGAFTYFKNRIVQPPGAQRTTDSAVSPCAINVRDTCLHTGNWYAALSRDHGQTWKHLDPYTFFPAPDGGFCCNQRVDYVRSHDLAVWLMQYNYSPVTQRGSLQIAVANGRDELRSGDAADWTLYRFDAGDFGFAPGTWLDFPDVSFNDDWLYLSANVFSGTTFRGAVVWRLALVDLQANGNAAFTYLTDATMGGSSYRFATRAGNGNEMFWATLIDTTTIRIWRQHSIGNNRDYVDRTTAPWQNTTTTTCPGPDGRGWLAGAKGVIRGACGTTGELVFAWGSDGNGSTRPHPYTRVARFRVGDRTLIAEHDVYSLTDCWAYAAIDSNSLGHIGGVFAIGGPTRHVRTSGFLIDQYDQWSAVVAYRMDDPTNNPPGQRFGAWFDVQRSWVDERTFVGTGNLMKGGDQQSHVEPRYVWFGRDDYQPVAVTLRVDSTPVQGVPIAIDVTDSNDQKNGTTGFVRTFARDQGCELTAPATFASGGQAFVFHRWTHDGLPRPTGQNVLSIDNMGTTDDVAIAEYRARRTLTFDASAHLPPVPVYLSPSDLEGRFGGSTVFMRDYAHGTQVTMTALATLNNHPFKHWRINGVAHPQGQLSVVHTVAGNATVVAVYHEHVWGTFTAFGSGCAGSNGQNHHIGSGTPETGQALQWRLVGGMPSSPAVLFLGASRTIWLGIPLPVPLPGAPDCPINVAIDLSLSTTTDAFGTGTVSITVPDDVSLIGGHVFTQFACVDLAANPFGLTTSNGLDTLVGGIR